MCVSKNSLFCVDYQIFGVQLFIVFSPNAFYLFTVGCKVPTCISLYFIFFSVSLPTGLLSFDVHD